jgi:type II secretory pathway component GspD/PulD (secretin)
MLLVASQVPYAQATYYRDYLTGAGHLTTGVSFRDVGTSLKVRAMVLPGNQIRVRMTPAISWFAADRSGIVEATEASTELVVPNDRPVVIGGATSQVNELTRHILGFAAGQSASEILLTVRARLLD